MPALLPAPKPRFSCSTTRASGNFARTRSAVPSADALSTTITSAPVPARLYRQRSIQAAALWVTTIALTSASAIGFARNVRPGRAANAFPGEDRRTGRGHQNRDHEEEKPGGECLFGADADVPEEADEERLAHGEAVDGERNEHHEKEERGHHVVRAGREVDADRLPAAPDREHANRLQREGDDEHRGEDADVVPVRVHRVVDAGDELVEADERKEGPAELQQGPCPAREQQDCEDDRRDDEERLDPEIRADVVVPDGEHEAEGGEDQRRS